MTSKRWFQLFLLWQLGGVAATTVFSVSAGSFHFFTHELIICLAFTNLVGLGLAAVVALDHLKLRHVFSPGVGLLISAVLAGIVLYFGSKLALQLGVIVCGTDHYEIGRWHVLAIVVNFITVVVATIFCILLMLYRRIAANLEKKIHENTELARLQLETKFALLQSKVNPHFLFNTLNTMLDVLRKEPEKVESMILNLSDIYRKTLALPDRSLVMLEEELELVREYLEIEKIRMGERLEYRFHVKEHLRQTRIPPMMVKILVENAIRHGLAPKKEGGAIAVKVDEQEDEKLVVDVEDTGVGIEPKPSYSGYGLACIKQQLKMLYDTRALMQISLAPSGGTHVRIELPYET